MIRARPRREALLTAVWYGALFCAIGAHIPYWPLWLSQWGLSEAEIATYLGLALALRVAGATLLPVIADRFAVRRAVITGAGLVAALSLLVQISIETRGLLLAATLVSALAMAPLGPLGEALGVRASAMHGFAYARVRAVGSAAFLGMNVGLGIVIAGYGTDVVPWVVAISLLGAAAVGLVHPGGGAPPGAGRDRTRFREALALARSPVFLIFALAASIGQASHAIYYVYGSLVWVAQGIGIGTVGLLWGAGVAAEIALMLGPGRRMVEWLGPAGAIAAGGAAGALRWALMSFEPPLALLWPLQALHALTFAIAHLGAMALVAAAIPPRLQASAQGLYGGGLGGTAFALATVAAGVLSAAFGPSSAYWLAAAMSFCSFAAALVLGRAWSGGQMVRDQT